MKKMIKIEKNGLKRQLVTIQHNSVEELIMPIKCMQCLFFQ